MNSKTHVAKYLELELNEYEAYSLDEINQIIDATIKRVPERAIDIRVRFDCTVNYGDADFKPHIEYWLPKNQAELDWEKKSLADYERREKETYLALKKKYG